MSKTFRIVAPSAAAAQALADHLNCEGHVATWLRHEKLGPLVLAECPARVMTHALAAVAVFS